MNVKPINLLILILGLMNVNDALGQQKMEYKTVKNDRDGEPVSQGHRYRWFSSIRPYPGRLIFPIHTRPVVPFRYPSPVLRSRQ